MERNQDPQPTATSPGADSGVFEQFGWQSFVDISPDAILVTDAAGVIIGANASATQLFGYETAELIGNLIEVLVPRRLRLRHPSHRETFNAHPRTRQMGVASNLVALRKDGTEVPVDILLKPIESPSGPLVLSFVRDMTEQRAVREAAQRNDEQFRSVVESVLDYAIYLLDADGRVKTWSYGAEQITGYTRNDALGLHMASFFPQEDQDRGQPARLIDQASLQGCVDDEGWRVRREGSRFWADSTITAIRSSVGEVVGFVEVVRDITDRKRTQDALALHFSDELQASSDALRASEARYRTVFQTSPDAVTISRLSDGVIVDVNQASLDITGYKRDEVLGKTATQLRIWVNSRDRFKLVEALRRDSQCRDMEAQFRRKNGGIFWARLSVSFIEIDGAPCILSFARDVSAAKQAEEAIKDLAFYDPLTGLANRRLLSERLTQSVLMGNRTLRRRAVLFIDLDDFKTLNDTLGHHIGDLMLQEVARRLAGCVRETDTVGRLGGDEFVVMLEDLSEIPEVAASQAKAVAEKILASLSIPYKLDGHQCRSGSSIGITVFGENEKGVGEILQQADIAMYQAKEAGRNTISVFVPELRAAVVARASAEEELRRAIEDCQFVLHYQPQVEDGRLTGAEALLRWDHPNRGIVFPGEFIPLAERTGLILPLGNWVLESACRQLADWATQKKTAKIKVAVNISVRQMSHPDFVGELLSMLVRTGANPMNLRLELTESMFVEQFDEIIRKITALKSHGVKFSIDDFGTGFSSLSYLKRLPIDQLKIERTFVHDIVGEASSGAIAESIILLSRALGLSVIAEGVETEAQRESLVRLGCTSFQGWLISKALPVHEFQAMC